MHSAFKYTIFSSVWFDVNYLSSYWHLRKAVSLPAECWQLDTESRDTICTVFLPTIWCRLKIIACFVGGWLILRVSQTCLRGSGANEVNLLIQEDRTYFVQTIRLVHHLTNNITWNDPYFGSLCVHPYFVYDRVSPWRVFDNDINLS